MNTSPKLPALKSLGALADASPVIVIDTREQTPLTFSRFPSVLGTLATGDYSFRSGEELFAVERKSIADLVGCCMGDDRIRFEKELCRLRGYRFKRLLIVGSEDDIRTGRYRSNIKPKAVLGSLWAFEARYDCPVVFAAGPEEGSALVERWAWWFSREIVEQANALLRGQQS